MKPRGAKDGKRVPLVALCAALALWGASGGDARAEMYKWVDENGGVHFTDNLFNVPQAQLPKIKTYQEAEEARGGDIPLLRSPAGYVVEVLVNGQVTARLVLDTGATATVISPGVLKQAGARFGVGDPKLVRTAGGEKMIEQAGVESLSVGGIRKGPMKIFSHDVFEGVDGLLGMDFLGAYKVEILSTGPTLRLTPP